MGILRFSMVVAKVVRYFVLQMVRPALVKVETAARVVLAEQSSFSHRMYKRLMEPENLIIQFK